MSRYLLITTIFVFSRVMNYVIIRVMNYHLIALAAESMKKERTL